MLEDMWDFFVDMWTSIIPMMFVLLLSLAVLIIPIGMLLSWAKGPQEYYKLNTKSWHCIEHRTVNSGVWSGKVWIPTTRQECTTYQEVR